jgi:FAD/FMN-containing dehydrogenase
VGEAVGQPARRQLLDHPAGDRLVEHGEQLRVAQPGGATDDVELELRPGRGRQLQHVVGARGEAGEPPADHLAHALRRAQLGQRPGEPDRATGQLDESRLDQRAPQLAHEERVAAGKIADRPRQLGRAGAGAGPVDELAHLGVRQATQPQAHDGVGAAQVGQRLRQQLGKVGLRVAEGGKQQHPRAARRPRQVAQEQQRRRVGPVPVLQREQHGSTTDPREQLRHRRVQPVALRIRIGLHRRRQRAHAGRQVGQQARQLAAGGAQRASQLLRFQHPHEVLERLDERAVGRVHDRVARAVEHERAAPGGLRGELAHEAALARAGLAADERHAPALVVGGGQERPQRLELGGAADEGEAGREAEWAGEGVHPGATIVRSDHRRSPRRAAKSIRPRHDSRSGTPYRRAPTKGDSVTTLTSAARAAQRELTEFRGRLIGPDDADYDAARAVYNAMIDKRPALIAQCADADDVALAVGFAREHDLLLAVRGGGHNGAGLGTCDGGVVVDLSPLKDIAVDPGARTVRVGGGCTWGEVDRATGEHGLATPSGIISTTGVGGLTLGGGLGHLTRGHGLTIDNLLAAEVVLASGERVRASADEHPDLFWAIRGGGGNFGVVTSFLFRLHEVGTIFGGPTFWPVEDAVEVLSAYREFLPAAPRELGGFFCFHIVPPGPPFPEAIHGREVCGVVWCYARDDEDAARAAMAPLMEATPEPLLHGVHTMPFPALQSAFDGLYPRGDQWYWRADFVDEVPDEAVRLHARYGAALPSGQSLMHLYPIDGAAHDVASTDTAWSYRDAKWATVYAGVDPDPANAAAIRSWTIEYFEALHPYSAGGAYVNMMMDEGQERVRASYRDNYDRLARIKTVYDPGNLFRVNQNIQPAA